VDGWIKLRAGDGQEVAFQRVAQHIAPLWPGQERPQQVHLDLLVDGHGEVAQRAAALGGARTTMTMNPHAPTPHQNSRHDQPPPTCTT